MDHRILPALSLLALAGCQAYGGGSSGYGANSYAPQRGPVLAGAESPSGSAQYTPFSPAQPSASGATLMPAVFTPTPSAKPPPVAPGGVFREIDPHGGDVGFWNEDPVAKREVATYADRYVERVSLRNGGVITYEMLNRGTFSDETDADLIKADLTLPPFRARGLSFAPDQLGRVGPFTYLAQSTGSYTCFIFRGKFGGAGNAQTEEAYGNLCYAQQAKDVASIKAEMIDLLTHVRFGPPAAATLAAAPEAARPAAGEASPQPVTVALERCRMAVSFSAAPAAGETGNGGRYSFAEGSYSEEASCSCKPDADYSKLSQFDVVDNVRRLAEARGYKLQKATFDETPELGKELAFEAVADKAGGDAFLIGRSFYRQCGFSALTTGVSYAELRKGRKFVESVAAMPASAAPAATAAVYDATVTNAAGSGDRQPEPAPDAAPMAPVAKAEAATPEAPPPAAGATLVADKPGEAAAAAGGGSGSTVAAEAEKPAAPDETVQRLRRLKLLLEQKLITPDEYDAKRQAILKTL
jgi:hypothetical protein